jgi:hypothetical protein
MAKLLCGHNENATCDCLAHELEVHRLKQSLAQKSRYETIGREEVAKQQHWNQMGWFERFGILLTGRNY